MAIFKRGQIWWIDLTLQSGERIRQTTKTTDKALAQQLHDKLKADSWRIDYLHEKPCYTWEDAAFRWLKETQHKTTHDEDKSKLRWLQTYLKGRDLNFVTRDVIQAILQQKAQEASTTTANRYLALIRAILRCAVHDWQWLEKVPKVKPYRETTRRVRWLTLMQAKTLLAELPEHQRDIVIFTLCTGLRQSNVIHLKWSQVDLARSCAWIHGDEAKAGHSIAVPLNDDALAALKRQLGKHEINVFTYKGKPIRSVNTRAWKLALARAGIEDFRWHDLRHTWASWHAQSGTPTQTLQELGAWRSPSMVQRYAHLSSSHLAGYAAKLPSLQTKPN
jgi:integrase